MEHRSFAPAIVALALLAALPSSRAQVPGMPAFDLDDARCREWGAAPGTKAYFECRATLERERARPGFGPPPAQPRPQQENVSDGMALAMCEAQARKVAPYPIERLASKFVFPGAEKRVSLSFKISKPGASLAWWNAECKFARGVMTDFSAH